ncbi:glycosyltransferase family 9 protein [Patescibacteria group bacterium]
MYKNVIYFANGSIGDFLVTASLMEDIHSSFEVRNCKLNLYIIVPRNAEIFSEFSDFCKSLQHLNIVEAGGKHPKGLFYLMKFIFSKNIVITQPTPGILPVKTKIMAKLLSLWKGSQLMGFDDGKKINRYLYDNLISFTDKILFFELLNKLFNILNIEHKKEVPRLDCKLSDVALKKYGLQKNKYVIVHPFGSSEKRSILEEELLWLVRIVGDISGLKVVITGSIEDKNFAESAIMGTENMELTGLNMREIHEILNGAKLFIGVDTGTTHMAGLLQKKSLIIANYGNPHWLPYYNKNATVLYNIEKCKHSIHKGKEHLEECRDCMRPLVNVPRNIIESELNNIFNE